MANRSTRSKKLSERRANQCDTTEANPFSFGIAAELSGERAAGCELVREFLADRDAAECAFLLREMFNTKHRMPLSLPSDLLPILP